MTLFTLEGLIRAHVRDRVSGADDPVPVVQHALQRWLHTQGFDWAQAGGPFAEGRSQPDGWLITERGLFAPRPGQHVRDGAAGVRRRQSGRLDGQSAERLEGRGGVMRAAPVALWSTDPEVVFALGAAAAALTHGHPSGYLSAASLAFLVHGLLRGTPLPDCIAALTPVLTRWPGHEEQLARLTAAVRLADEGPVSPERMAEELGGGWVGEETLAIAVVRDAGDRRPARGAADLGEPLRRQRLHRLGLRQPGRGAARRGRDPGRVAGAAGASPDDHGRDQGRAGRVRDEPAHRRRLAGALSGLVT